MKTKDIKEEILRRTDNGRLVFEHYSGCDRAHKNFLNPEYHDTKPSCNFFFSHEKQTYLYKDHGGYISGDCFRFVAGCLNMDCKTQFRMILECINRDLVLNIDFGGRDSPFIPKKLPTAQPTITSSLRKKKKPPRGTSS